jgi:hypothetical protein
MTSDQRYAWEVRESVIRVQRMLAALNDRARNDELAEAQTDLNRVRSRLEGFATDEARA